MLGWLPRQLKILSSVNRSFSLADDPNPFESGKNMNDSLLGTCLMQEHFIHYKNKHKMNVVIG